MREIKRIKSLNQEINETNCKAQYLINKNSLFYISYTSQLNKSLTEAVE